MIQRGRKSSASLTVIGPKGIEAIHRPEPPAELTPEQAEEWHEIVNRLPADWFPRESHALLVQYCRAIARSRRLAELIQSYEKNKKFDPEEYQALLRSEVLVSRAIATLATRMRINQSSSSAYLKRHERRPSQVAKPWDDDED